jgi:hypothetical protein
MTVIILEKTEKAIKNGQCKITGNIGHAKTKEEDKQNNITQHRKL